MHHGSLSTIRYNEYKDLLSKEHESLNKLPLTTKNETTFLHTETHFPTLFDQRVYRVGAFSASSKFRLPKGLLFWLGGRRLKSLV